MTFFADINARPIDDTDSFVSLDDWEFNQSNVSDAIMKIIAPDIAVSIGNGLRQPGETFFEIANNPEADDVVITFLSQQFGENFGFSVNGREIVAGIISASGSRAAQDEDNLPSIVSSCRSFAERLISMCDEIEGKPKP